MHTLSKLILAASLAAAEFLWASPVSDLQAPVPAANADLLAHQQRFAEAELIQVKDNIYVAHGYDMSNIIFIEGPSGLVIMDTGFRVENARRALAAMREISDKPIRAVFYSHGHADHVGGSGAFKAEAPDAQFIAHEKWQRNINYISSAVRPTFTLRAFAQLGLVLPEGLQGTVGSGGGPVLRAQGTLSYVEPTRTAADGEWLEIAGLRLQALHTPGDLDDGLSLWFPDYQMVLTGDTVTHSHVHAILSTPRHEPGRDAQAFVNSMTRIESLGAELLIGGHGDVVEGKAAVKELVHRDRRSAQFMIDEVVRYIRGNQSGDYVQSHFAYPQWFLDDQDRGDYYHRVSWITRGVYAQLMGWFGGDATDLAPVSPDTRAQRIIHGFGGVNGAAEKLRSAYGNADHKWAMELATYILAVAPSHTQARQIKSWSMKAIAYSSESANQRNYLLTQAMILDGYLSVPAMAAASQRRGLPETHSAADAAGFLHTLGARLNVEAARDTNLAFKLTLSDRDQAYFLQIDRGVLLVSRYEMAAVDFAVEIGHSELALVSEGMTSWQALYQQENIVLDGNRAVLAQLDGLF